MDNMTEAQAIEWAEQRIKHWTDFLRKIFPPAKDTVYTESSKRYPAVTFSNRMRTTAGTANGYYNRIKINTDFLFRLGKDFERTLAHEVAHVVADQHRGTPCKHGPIWKSVFAVSGFGNKRCHSYDCEQPATILWECPGCQRHLGCGKSRLTYLTNRNAEIVCQCGHKFDTQTMHVILTKGYFEPWKASVSKSSNAIREWCKKKVVL